ncbi:hypothetical protein PFISCL1PPCAC_12532 [Pristionchus fissidentatus]|uniref:UBC core domain-containing protein n=1 Tax=Pristionchus fissidentatus TaxID=1538716 RepID=A0AAV5VRD7_9BILA|nr:hypothetical protein PFISCL1PPCAC_12532 [Pristionchus fissidentatus]
MSDDSLSSSDEDQQPVAYGTSDNRKSRGFRPSNAHNIDLDSAYLVNKFDRPLPVKEDLIIYVERNKIKLGYVNKVSYKDQSEDGCAGGTFFVVDEIPNMRPTFVHSHEGITVDRCFSVGETVMMFKNKHEGTDMAINRCHANTMIGQVIAVRTTADVLRLPENNVILKDVPIDKFKMTELMNYNSSHNYVLYKEWIGDITEMENEVTCFYKKQRVVINESSKLESHFIRKGEGYSNKSLIPGEAVYVELRTLTSKYAKWEGEPPTALQKRAARPFRSSEKIRLVIEKVDPFSISVKWIQSPSVMTMPDTKIMKEEINNITLIDVSANTRVSSADRMVFTIEKDVRKMTKREYSDYLNKEYRHWFDSPKTRQEKKKKEKMESTSLNTVHEEEEEMKSVKDEDHEEGDEEMEVDEHGTGDVAGAHDEDEEEEDEGEEESGGGGKGGKKTSSNSLAPADLLPPVTSGRGVGRLKRGRKMVRTREPRKKKAASGSGTVAQPEKKDPKMFKGTAVGEVMISHTMCDVEWMDGTITKDIHGAQLVPIDPDLDQQDHLPGNIIAKKSDEQTNYDDTFGIILSVNPHERVAQVRWFTLIDRRVVNAGAQHTGDEECTLFDIMPHPYFKRQFCGYLALCLSKSDGLSTPDMKTTGCKILANLQNGKQLVEYFDGTRDEVWPMELMTLPLHEHEEDSEMDGEVDWINDTAAALASQLPPATAAEIQRVVSGAVAAAAAESGPSTSSAIAAVETALQQHSTSSKEVADKIAEREQTPMFVRRSTRSSVKKRKTSVAEEEEEELIPKSLPVFEKGTFTVLDGEVLITHKYINDAVCSPSRQWMKAVMREHTHLKEHLPAEIHLWAWENRLDLMTLVIFGPADTPFELTPFHFDIHIPDNFPAAPPKVHYYAWSQEQLNPNLYQVGKVCVSLLGTWDGDAAEKWTPTSNLLQVFLSIQGLILNAEPYFNEAGYESRKNVPEHEANSKRYNETAAINSLEYLWRIYDRPPAHIQAVVRQGVDAKIAEFKSKVLEWAEGGEKKPGYPVHASKGFCLALKTTMGKIVSIVNKHNAKPSDISLD